MGSLYFKLKSCLFVISSGIIIIFSTNKAHFTHDHAVVSIYGFMFLKLHLRCLLLASFISLLSSCSCWTFTQNLAITKLLLQQLTNTVPFQAQRNSIQSQLDMHTYLDCGQAVPFANETWSIYTDDHPSVCCIIYSARSTIIHYMYLPFSDNKKCSCATEVIPCLILLPPEVLGTIQNHRHC